MCKELGLGYAQSGTQTHLVNNCILQSKNTAEKDAFMCQMFGDLFLFGLVWQYSSVQTKYDKGRFKVMATYM